MKKLVITLLYDEEKNELSYDLDGNGIVPCHSLKDLGASVEAEALYFGTDTCKLPEPE